VDPVQLAATFAVIGSPAPDAVVVDFVSGSGPPLRRLAAGVLPVNVPVVDMSEVIVAGGAQALVDSFLSSPRAVL
jgi:hypothetical protein